MYHLSDIPVEDVYDDEEDGGDGLDQAEGHQCHCRHHKVSLALDQYR